MRYRLNRVITQLLEFARPLTIEKKRSSVQNLIQLSLRMIERHTSEKNIRIERALPPEIVDAEIDPDMISQALLNLYLNAVEAMEEKGGVLTVALAQELDPRLSLKIAVSDTGTGISKEDLDHIFDPYFTTKVRYRS